MVFNAAQFLAQPISDCYQLTAPEWEIALEIREESKQRLNSIEAGSHLKPELEEKVKDFIRSEIGIGVESFSFRIIPDTVVFIGIVGSVNNPVIVFAPDFASEMEVEFKPLHKFAIAHEIGHYLFDEDLVLKKKRSSKVGLIAWSTVFWSSLVLSGDLLTSYLLGCTVGKCAKLYADWKMGRQEEFRADAHAASKSKEIALGGIEMIGEMRKLVLKKNWLKPRSGFLGRIERIVNEALITTEGDLIGRKHPPGEARIQNIRKAMV